VKTIVFAAVLATLVATSAIAETHSIPNDNPSVTVTIPDNGWSVTEIDTGIEVSSDDDEVYMAIQGVPLKNLVDLVGQTIAYPERAGVTVDKSSEKETKGTINGMDMHDIGWSGKDKDGDVVIHLLMIAVSGTQAVMFTYWASPDGDKQYDAEVTKMVRSIKKAG
jgi:hypothetical protein